MKKILFSLILFCGIIAISQSCKKNSDIQTNDNIENVDVADELIEEIEAPETIEDETNDYDPEATSKIISIVSDSVATNDEDWINDCSTYKYNGYNIAKHDDHIRFVITLSQKDTLLQDSVKSSRTDITSDEPLHDPTGTGHLINRIDDTHYYFYPRFNPSFGGKYSVKYTFYLTPKADKPSKAISKSVKILAKGYLVAGDLTSEGDDRPYTSNWIIGKYKKLIARTLTLVSSPSVAEIDTNYIPSVGDVITFQNSASKTKKGIITAPSVFKPATKTKGASYVFYVAEMNNKPDCKGSATTKRKNLERKSFPDNIRSVDTTYKATSYQRFFNP